MKTIADGVVLDRMYYYLLDFNDLNYKDIMLQKFNKNSLCLLTKVEFIELFNLVVKLDLMAIE